MRLRVFVNDLERFRAARSEQEIVPADVVLDDREHRPAAIRVENVTFCQVNAVRVIDAAAGRKPFAFIRVIERDEIRDLFAFEIDNAQMSAGAEFEGRAGLRFEAFQCAKGHLLAVAKNGAFQSSSTARPEYCRASDCTPKSLSIGLTVPWRSRSRCRIVSCIRCHFPSARNRSNWSCGLKTSAGQGNRRAFRELLGCIPIT